MYAIMGALAGVLGQSFSLFGYQRAVGIAAGAFMKLGVILPARFLSKVWGEGAGFFT